jgi:hypothetical protein
MLEDDAGSLPCSSGCLKKRNITSGSLSHMAELEKSVDEEAFASADTLIARDLH